MFFKMAHAGHDAKASICFFVSSSMRLEPSVDMPTDSASAIGIFVGVCIGSADALKGVKPKNSENARRTGVGLMFDRTFIVKIAPLEIASAVAAGSILNGNNGQIPTIVAIHRVQLSFSKMALFALERIESILVGSQIHESAMRGTSTPVSASRTPPSPQLINN